MSESSAYNRQIPEDKKNIIWNLMRYGLIFTGIISLIAVITVTPLVGIPLGYDILPEGVPLGNAVIFIVFVSMFTTFLHECMHMIYAQSKRLHLQINKSIAVVSMSHIWVWSFFSRITALAAGIIFDLFLLACMTCLQLFFDSWMLVTSSSILWVRILWQFGFHRKCDGQFIAMAVLDNPVISKDVITSGNTLKKDEDRKLWNRLIRVGYMVDAIIFLFWIVPLIIRLLIFCNILYNV